METIVLSTRVSQFGYHKIELCDLVKQDRIFKLASFVKKNKATRKDLTLITKITESTGDTLVKGNVLRLNLCAARNKGKILGSLRSKQNLHF